MSSSVVCSRPGKGYMMTPVCRLVRKLFVDALLTVPLLQSASAVAQEIAPNVPNASAPTVGEVAVPDQIGSSIFGPRPDDLSPWGMFLHADTVVKIVILGLLAASMVTWTIWLAKTIELATAKRRLRQPYRLLRDARSLTLAAASVGTSASVARTLVKE